MAKQLKLRRGTTSQHSSFTGAEGEVTVDTTKDTLVVHDGSTAGGIPLAKESAAYTHPNHSGEVTSSADGAQTIASNVVDEDNLKISNSGTNGQYLQKQSGNTGGLTWADVPAGVGGNTGLDLNDDVKLRVGTGNDFSFYHDGTNGFNIIKAENNNYTRVVSDTGLWIWNAAQSAYVAYFDPGNGCVLRDSGNVDRLTTTTSGVTIGGTVTASAFSGSGTALEGLNASNLQSGTINGARFPATLPAASGVNLTSLNASSLGSGTVPTARLGSGTANSSKVLKGNNTWGDLTITSDSHYNTVGGTTSFSSNSNATKNTIFGYQAGNSINGSTNDGDNNTIIGYQAMANSDRGYNTAIGYQALQNSGGQYLTAIGRLAGQYYNGWSSVLIGGGSGGSATSGANYNTIIGNNSFYGASSWAGDNNVAIGESACYRNTGTSDSAVVGHYTLFNATTATQNTTLGSETFRNLTTGTGNVAIGYRAGYTGGSNAITTGSNNILIGKDAQASSATVSNEITFGNTSITKFRIPGINFELADNGGTPTNGHVLTMASGGATWAAAGGGISSDSAGNTLGGTTAGNSISSGGEENTCFGMHAGDSITTQDNNTYIGRYAGKGSTGYQNTYVGRQYAALTGDGYRNTAVGSDALGAITSGNNNTGLGRGAGGSITTGSYNVAIGSVALGQATTGSQNIALGSACMQECIGGSDNVGAGHNALKDITSGGQNVAIGRQADENCTTGSDNIALGMRGLADHTTGGNNIGLGNNAGGSITSGANNIMIGTISGSSSSPSGNITTQSNIICLGSNSITDIYCADTSISSSDKRDKADVTDFTHGLKWVNQLKPVTYKWDKRTWYNEYDEEGKLIKEISSDGSRKKTKQHIGFLAQDVLAIEQADGYASKKDDMLIVNLNEDGSAYGLKYERLVPVLVNAIKELSAKVTALEAK